MRKHSEKASSLLSPAALERTIREGHPGGPAAYLSSWLLSPSFCFVFSLQEP